MKIIGLTGGIASGKSTVSKIIRQMRIPVICADEIAHLAIVPGKPAYKKIVKEFGKEMLHADKTVNRTKLGSLVFSSSSKREILNSIVHPEVIHEMKEEIENLKKKKANFVVLDIPLLFEEKLDKMCDEVILVYTPQEILKKRLALRDHLNPTEVENRLVSQMPIEEKKKKADHIIDNSGNLAKTKEQVEQLFEKWK